MITEIKQKLNQINILIRAIESNSLEHVERPYGGEKINIDTLLLFANSNRTQVLKELKKEALRLDNLLKIKNGKRTN